MADTTEEEHLDEQVNVQSENPSDGHSPITETETETETIPQNQEVENMEVHHHPHVGKKSFKEYLLEGLMIFIAVTMGFIAESIREHLLDKEKEKQYIEAFVQDLKADTASIKGNIKRNLRKEKGVDSLLLISDKDLTNPENAKKFIAYFLMGSGVAAHNPNTSALTQFKNTGSLRLVSYRKGVADSILRYDAFNQTIIKHNEIYAASMLSAFDAIYPIVDVKIFRDSSYSNFFRQKMTEKQVPPLHLSQEKLNIFLGYETRHALTNEVNRALLENQLRNATRLIAFLNKEYNLE